jgi:hypothetical protein
MKGEEFKFETDHVAILARVFNSAFCGRSYFAREKKWKEQWPTASHCISANLNKTALP